MVTPAPKIIAEVPLTGPKAAAYNIAAISLATNALKLTPDAVKRSRLTDKTQIKAYEQQINAFDAVTKVANVLSEDSEVKQKVREAAKLRNNVVLSATNDANSKAPYSPETIKAQADWQVKHQELGELCFRKLQATPELRGVFEQANVTAGMSWVKEMFAYTLSDAHVIDPQKKPRDLLAKAEEIALKAADVTGASAPMYPNLSEALRSKFLSEKLPYAGVPTIATKPLFEVADKLHAAMESKPELKALVGEMCAKRNLFQLTMSIQQTQRSTPESNARVSDFLTVSQKVHDELGALINSTELIKILDAEPTINKDANLRGSAIAKVVEIVGEAHLVNPKEAPSNVAKALADEMLKKGPQQQELKPHEGQLPSPSTPQQQKPGAQPEAPKGSSR